MKGLRVVSVIILALFVFFGIGVSPETQAAADPAPPERVPPEQLQGRARDVFDHPSVVLTALDQRTGKLTVGVEQHGASTEVLQRLRDLGIGPAQVDVVVTQPIVQLATLQETAADIQAGYQVAFGRFPRLYACTIGFNAISNGVSGFVTASHCTNKQGGTEGTTYFQPLTGAVIAAESSDPLYFTGGVCPAKKKCRYSDSAFAAYSTGRPHTLGAIARTDAVNTGSLTVAGSFAIAANGGGNATIGTLISKVGRTTGWSQGAVTFSCAHTAVQGTNIIQLCQDHVSASVGGGDSGGPVFTGSGPVTLQGVLWGGNQAGTSFVYSPITNVMGPTELGSLTTF